MNDKLHHIVGRVDRIRWAHAVAWLNLHAGCGNVSLRIGDIIARRLAGIGLPRRAIEQEQPETMAKERAREEQTNGAS